MYANHLEQGSVPGKGPVSIAYGNHHHRPRPETPRDASVPRAQEPGFGILVPADLPLHQLLPV